MPRALARAAVAGDALWVILSIIALLAIPATFTFWGKMVVLDVALAVGVLGAAQYYYLRPRGLS